MNNLDPEVAEKPEELVVYGGIGRAARNWESFDAIVKALNAPKLNYGVPKIVVTEASADRLYLEHVRGDVAPLDQHYAQKTLEYVYDLWKGPVELTTWQRDKTVRLTVGPDGFESHSLED